MAEALESAAFEAYVLAFQLRYTPGVFIPVAHSNLAVTNIQRRARLSGIQKPHSRRHVSRPT